MELNTLTGPVMGYLPPSDWYIFSVSPVCPPVLSPCFILYVSVNVFKTAETLSYITLKPFLVKEISMNYASQEDVAVTQALL